MLPYQYNYGGHTGDDFGYGGHWNRGHTRDYGKWPETSNVPIVGGHTSVHMAERYHSGALSDCKFCVDKDGTFGWGEDSYTADVGPHYPLPIAGSGEVMVWSKTKTGSMGRKVKVNFPVRKCPNCSKKHALKVHPSADALECVRCEAWVELPLSEQVKPKEINDATNTAPVPNGNVAGIPYIIG